MSFNDQLLETNVSITEMGLRNIIQQLKNQVLFLLDDYKEMCSVPQVIARMIQKKTFVKDLLVDHCPYKQGQEHPPIPRHNHRD